VTDTFKIGFAGLGQLGSALARKLDQSHGLSAIWNRTPKDIGFASTNIASSFEELCGSVDWLFSCVADDKALDAITYQLEQTPRRPKIHLSFATCSPAQVLTSDERHKALDIAFVNAPVLGRPDIVETGNAGILVSGEAGAVDQVTPCLKSICNSLQNLGTDPCLSAAVKLSINYLVACHIAGVSEALSVMSQLEGGTSGFLKTLEQSALDSPVMRLFSHAVEGRQFTPALFDLRLAQKDLDYFRSIASPEKDFHVASGIRKHMEQSNAAFDHAIDWTGLAAHLF